MVRVRAMLVIPATIVEVSIFVQTTAAAMADVKIGKKMHGWRPAHYFLFFSVRTDVWLEFFFDDSFFYSRLFGVTQ